MPSILQAGETMHWSGLLKIAALYLSSHLFRMVRLALLTLDERDKAFPLVAAHTLTAFPSSFLPFKIGEVLRLAAFLHVFERRRKAIAVWLAERFGDVLVITLFILGLYLLKIPIPSAMHTVFVLFVVAGAIGLLGMFATAKVFVYVNRHLVLASHSVHGLALLRASHLLRGLELDVQRSVEGRLSALFLLSLFIWAVEISALSMFINQFAIGEPDWASLFAAGLLASLPGGAAVAVNFGLYQSLALVVLTLLFLLLVWVIARFKFLKV